MATGELEFCPKKVLPEGWVIACVIIQHACNDVSVGSGFQRQTHMIGCMEQPEEGGDNETKG